MEHLDKDRLLAAIVRDEGAVINDGKHTLYKDHLGYWTIGYGKLVDPDQGGGLSEDEAMYLLQNTLKDMWEELSSSLPWIEEKNEEVQEALLNMCYNLGLPRLLQFQNMLDAIESDDGVRAYAEALDSKWARQVGQRAHRIAEIFRAEL